MVISTTYLRLHFLLRLYLTYINELTMQTKHDSNSSRFYMWSQMISFKNIARTLVGAKSGFTG